MHTIGGGGYGAIDRDGSAKRHLEAYGLPVHEITAWKGGKSAII